MTETSNLILWYRRDNGTMQQFPISTGIITIGSSNTCSLKIEDETLAAEQARLQITPEGILLTNLSGKITILLDNQPLEEQHSKPIQPGQSFSMKNFQFTLVEQDAVQAAFETGFSESTSPPSMPASGFRKERIMAWLKENGLIAGISFVIVALLAGTAAFFIFANMKKPDIITPPATLLPVTVSAEQTSQPTDVFSVSPRPESSADASELQINAPGFGEIEIAPILMNLEQMNLAEVIEMGIAISSGQSVNLETVISGSNIGYVYSYIGLYQEKDGKSSILTTAMTHISAKDTRDVGGVQYPDWGQDGEIPIHLDWEPAVYRINDGTKAEIALLYPLSYAASLEDTVLAVDGIYLFADNSPQRPARITFDNQGKMRSVFGFKSTGEIETASEIIPQSGDRFTILLKQFNFEDNPGGQPQFSDSGSIINALPMDLNAITGSNSGIKPPFAFGKGSFSQFEGGTLTFSEKRSFLWEKDTGHPGNYVVGLIAEDMDGNFYAGYIPILVKE